LSEDRLRLGDVFVLSLDDERIGIGQVVATYRDDAYFFALFSPAYERDQLPDLRDVLQEPIAVLALSLDAKVAVGDWIVIGNLPVADDIPLPAYKEMVGSPERVDVVDFSGEQRRPARGEEAEWLPNRKVVAPVRLERALRARHGLEPWLEAYAALEPSQVATTARLFNQG
jgi:hypothetical protein